MEHIILGEILKLLLEIRLGFPHGGYDLRGTLSPGTSAECVRAIGFHSF